MKKTFFNAILLASAAFVALMVATPLNHLSAQNEVSIDPKQRVHKTSILSINAETRTLTVDIDGVSVPVTTNASTTVSLGNGNETELGEIRNGSNVYVFGTYDPESKSILADKIVVRNKSKTERTSLSRAQLENQATPQVPSGPLDDLGLTVK